MNLRNRYNQRGNDRYLSCLQMRFYAYAALAERLSLLWTGPEDAVRVTGLGDPEDLQSSDSWLPGHTWFQELCR